MSNKGSRCMAFDHAICITSWGAINPCCSTSTDVAKINNEMNIVEYWRSDKHLNDLREQEYFGDQWLYPCGGCRKKSQEGLITRKDRFIRWYPYVENVNRGEVLHFDINLGNLCNQQCVTCNSNYSSKWLQDDIDIMKTNSEFRKHHKLSLKNWSLSDEHLDQTLSLITQSTRRIEIKGGEPLFHKKINHLLEEISKNAPTVELNMCTNGTRLADPNTLEAIRLIKNLNLDISIDGTGKIYEWIRGWSWDDILYNIRSFATNTDHPIRLNYTTTIHNINEYQNMYAFAEQILKEFPDKRVSINFSQVAISPLQVSPKLSSRKRKLIAIQQLNSLLNDDKSIMKKYEYSTFINSVKILVRFFQENLDYIRTPADEKLLNDYHDKMVQIRGWDIGKEYME